MLYNLCYDNTNENSNYYKCLSTNTDNLCEKCINNLNLNSGDRKCTISVGCKKAENYKKCLECDNFFCLDVKKGICVDNDYIEDESEKIYINCNRTNEEGTACEVCLNGYTLSEDGLCIDDLHCAEEKNGACQRCLNEDFESYCLNEYFGCIPSTYGNCLECNDIFHISRCTKCYDGYELNNFNICVKSNEEE